VSAQTQFDDLSSQFTQAEATYAAKVKSVPGVRQLYKEQLVNKLNGETEEFEGEMLLDWNSDSRLARHEMIRGVSRFMNTCTSLNPHYCFDLRKDTASAWRIDNCVVTGAKDIDTKTFGFLNGVASMRRPSQEYFCPPGMTISGLQGSAFRPSALSRLHNFEFVKVQPHTDRLDAICVVFRYDAELYVYDGKRKAASTVNCVLAVDPIAWYAPIYLKQSARVLGEEVHYVCRRDLELDSNSLVTKISDDIGYQHMSLPGTPLIDKSRMYRETIEYQRLSPKAFTLAAFELPEPTGPSRPTPWGFSRLIIVLGSMVLLLAWYLHKRLGTQINSIHRPTKR
jgi:hypothetical protein